MVVRTQHSRTLRRKVRIIDPQAHVTDKRARALGLNFFIQNDVDRPLPPQLNRGAVMLPLAAERKRG